MVGRGAVSVFGSLTENLKRDRRVKEKGKRRKETQKGALATRNPM
jgi:hypothetical protein